jgi:MFS family permease
VRAGEWLGLAVLALPTLLVSLDLFVMLLAVPHLSAALHASSTQQLWILDIYGFMVAGLLLTMGTLGGRIGRRRLLPLGAAVFGTASILAARSTRLLTRRGLRWPPTRRPGLVITHRHRQRFLRNQPSASTHALDAATRTSGSPAASMAQLRQAMN